MKILVYTPGKCGSTALTHGIRRAGFDVKNAHREGTKGVGNVREFDKYITVLRDPFEQVVSCYFENSWKEGRTAKEMIDEFLKDTPFTNHVLEWAKREAEFLLDWNPTLTLHYRTRDYWPAGVSNFLGKTVELPEVNVSSEKKYGKVFTEFKRLIKFSPYYVHSVVASNYARRALSEEERAHYLLHRKFLTP